MVQEWKNPTASLQGQLLIASPHMEDPRFKEAVIMICQHDSNSAMGVIINQQSDKINLSQLCETLDIGTPAFCGDQPIHIGGPVNSSRGFVLHSKDHMRPESVTLTNEIGLTSSIKILREISDGIGPKKAIISLGCAGWSAGQLDSEITQNAWLCLPSSSEIVFYKDIKQIWRKTYEILGVEPGYYVYQPGNA